MGKEPKCGWVGTKSLSLVSICLTTHSMQAWKEGPNRQPPFEILPLLNKQAPPFLCPLLNMKECVINYKEKVVSVSSLLGN